MYKHNIVNFELCNYSIRHGRYGGQAGDKDGIIYNDEYWIAKYPKSTKSMQGTALPLYTSSPLSEYIGSHIYEILDFPVHKTLLGIRNNQLIVACKDFQNNFGDLAEIRTLKNAANKQIADIAEENLPESATGDKIVLEELLLHFDKNPLFWTKGLEKQFWSMVIIDILIGNNDRNNGNWGVLFDEKSNQYIPAPVYDNGNAFNNKTNDARISELLNENDVNKILGERTIYTYKGKLLSAKKIIELDIPQLQHTLIELFPIIESKLDKIESFIDSIPCKFNNINIISEDRKKYYNKTLEQRTFELLKPAYEKAIVLYNPKEVNCYEIPLD